MAQRVLLINTDLEIGGTPSVVRELATRLRGPETQTAVVCIGPWGPVAGELQNRAIRTHILGARWGWQLPRVVAQIAKIAKDYDVVYSSLIHANFCTALASKFWGKRKYFQSIHNTQPDPRWHWKLQGFCQRSADQIIVPSQSVANVAHDWSKIPHERLKIIPNAIDVESFIGLARQSNYPTERFRVGFVGRLDPVKRVPDLVAALAHMEHTELHIYGEGEDRPNIAKKIDEIDAANRVILHGAIDGPYDALRQIDALVLPSESEGFGLVLIEAMAAGIPVIATDVPGIRDVVKPEHTGVLVPIGSPEELAGAITRIRDDADLRRTLCANALIEVRQRYTWDNVIREYRSLMGLAD